MPKPLLIYDGDCNFCRRWILRWKKITRDQVDYAPYQETAGRFPQIPKENFSQAVQLIESDGNVLSGARAVFKALAAVPGRGGPLRLYENLPGFAAASEWFYGIVARHRVLFSKLTTLFWGKNLEPPSYVLSSWLFMRCLGIIYLIAFVSLGVQIQGLIGSDGIYPAHLFLDAVQKNYGPERFHILPTIFWWISPTDPALQFSCWAGAALSGLVILDLAPSFLLLVLWALYLSLSTVSREFLSFQWDILLLETGFLAVFLNPPRIFRVIPAKAGIYSWMPAFGRFLKRAKDAALPRPCSVAGMTSSPGPSCLTLWLCRFLLFKLMFQSGCVKLLSGDPNWRNLTALNYHYETQPIPSALSWYAHHIAPGFQKFSTAAMFGIEILVPFLIFLPRRAKLFSFSALIFFQILIILTGNYCFFNLLTIALCLLLLDDGYLRPILKIPSPLTGGGGYMEFLRKGVLALVAAVVLFVSSVELAGMFLKEGRVYPRWIAQVLENFYPYRTINSYGLFAVMTTTRAEIIVEGSSDGKTWLAYEFKWKPGDLSRRPPYVAPHQPRLDWQMWFAALGNIQQNSWFVNFLFRLLQGSKPILALLEKNPFPDHPPKLIRARLYDYHFTTAEEKKSDGNWWKRQLLGDYCPPISLRRN